MYSRHTAKKWDLIEYWDDVWNVFVQLILFESQARLCRIAANAELSLPQRLSLFDTTLGCCWIFLYNILLYLGGILFCWSCFASIAFPVYVVAWSFDYLQPICDSPEENEFTVINAGRNNGHFHINVEPITENTAFIANVSRKLLFLHKLVRIYNSVLKACYDMFSHLVEFTLLCYSFDIALDLCSEVDKRSKVFSAFNHTVHSRWVLLKLTVCFYCMLFLYCILSVLIVCLLPMANKLHHIIRLTTTGHK